MLKEIIKGIYSHDGLMHYNYHELFVFVHPFYNISDNNPKIIYPEKTKEEYLEKLELFYANYPGPMITLESSHSFDKTIDRIFSLNNHQNQHFITTKMYESQPRHCSWDDVTGFIESFGKNRVYFAGGELNYFFEGLWQSYKGRCLGTAMKEIGKRTDMKLFLWSDLIFIRPSWVD